MRPRLLSLAIFSLITFIVTSPVAKSAQPEQPDIVEVVAQGMGIDANSALLNAYSNAVQQALGLYIDAETLVKNDVIVRDKILTYSKGFIQEATKINESQANGLFQVKIRAKVKQQQLFEQVKANNISAKPLDGLNLHAQVESQLKQDKDAKELLGKVLLPLAETNLHRAELAPSTTDQPNPTIDKSETDDYFVTLDFKIFLWIDEREYLKYVKNNLIPVLDQMANEKLLCNSNVTTIKPGHINWLYTMDFLEKKYGKKNIFIYLLYGERENNNGMIYVIQKDHIPFENIYKIIRGNVYIKLSLFDERKELVVSESQGIFCHKSSCFNRNWHNAEFSTFPASLFLYFDRAIFISPYFTSSVYESTSPFNESIDQRIKELEKISIFIKIARKDLPRINHAKLEIFTTAGK